MLGERVAILAATLLFFKWFPRQGASVVAAAAAAAAGAWTGQPRFQQRNRHTVRRLEYPTARPPTFTLVVASGRPPRAEDFGSHLPHTGRFGPQHKSGRKVAAAAVVGEVGEVEDPWSTALAALAASATALAYDTRPDSCSRHLDEGADGERSPRRGHDRQEQWQNQPQGGDQQHHRDQRPLQPQQRRRHQDDRARSLAFPLLQRLQEDFSSNLHALSSWNSERRDQLRRQVAAARRRPLSIVAGLPALGTAGGLRAVDSASEAARGACSELADWAAHLSGLTAGAYRLAVGALFAAIMSGGSKFGKIRNRVTRYARRNAALDGTGDGAGEPEGEYEGSRLARLTDMTVQNVVDVVARDGWEHVATTSGIVVHRQYIALGPDGTPTHPAGPARGADSSTAATAAAASAAPPMAAGIEWESGERGVSVSDGATVSMTGVAATEVAAVGARGEYRAEAAPQFACVKATAILAVPPEVVYLLFADNSRVGEYNEHCREVKDLEILSPDSKITWAASGRMGPFKARDFCTLVHFRTLSDGTLAQVSRPVEHPLAPRSSRYVRSEILLAGNFMRPIPGDPSRTEFLMVTHVNPGGAAETRAGAMLVNSLCASSPVNFIRRLESAAVKLMHELQETAHDHDAAAAGVRAAVGGNKASPNRAPPKPPQPTPLSPPPPSKPPEGISPGDWVGGIEEASGAARVLPERELSPDSSGGVGGR